MLPVILVNSGILVANRGKAIIDRRDANPFKESNALARRHELGGCGFRPGAIKVIFHEISIKVYSVKSNLTYCVQNFIAYYRFYCGIGLKPSQVLIQDANHRTGTLGSLQFAPYQTKSYTNISVQPHWLKNSAKTVLTLKFPVEECMERKHGCPWNSNPGHFKP